MKILVVLISFLTLFTGQAYAHTDHALGEGALHTFYHITFWVVFALVVYKGYMWFKKKKSEES